MPHIWSLLAEIWRSTPLPVKGILTAAIGTIIGAWLTSRANTKRRVVDELRALHAAYALCFTVANKALALKRQHLRPMWDKYSAATEAYDAYVVNPIGPFAIDLDLQTLSQPRFADESLERIVFEKCSLGHRGLAAIVSLRDATKDVKESIDFRNDLINNFRENTPATEFEKIAVYVGAYHEEKVDQRFGHNLEALFKQIDDCIFFSMFLADQILQSERKLRGRNWWRFRLNLPKQYPADWSLARNEALIPPESQYVDWLRGFKKPPSWWQRLETWFRGLRNRRRRRAGVWTWKTESETQRDVQ